MWGWNESGQLALPSKALAEEGAQDKDPGAGEGAAGRARDSRWCWNHRQCQQLGVRLMWFQPAADVDRARSFLGAEGRFFPRGR